MFYKIKPTAELAAWSVNAKCDMEKANITISIKISRRGIFWEPFLAFIRKRLSPTERFVLMADKTKTKIDGKRVKSCLDLQGTGRREDL